MAAEDEELLPLRPIHRSLERRIMLKGGERELVMVAFILGILVGVVDSVGFGPWIGVPAGIGVTVGALWVARACLLYTSPSPRDRQKSRMPSSA